MCGGVPGMEFGGCARGAGAGSITAPLSNEECTFVVVVL